MEFKHISVMLNECINGLNIRPDKIYIDGTAGGAGHSTQIAKRLTTGKLIALDQDPTAVEIATQRLSDFKTAQVVKSNFRELDFAIDQLDIGSIDGVL
ncbi:MAG: 16S rRNA (cytosine(1402)-N(4))-methyltransferase, partial [Oscillospiraceae bacterium]